MVPWPGFKSEGIVVIKLYNEYIVCSAVEFLTKVTGVPGSIHRPAIYCHCNNAQSSFPTVHWYVLFPFSFMTLIHYASSGICI